MTKRIIIILIVSSVFLHSAQCYDLYENRKSHSNDVKKTAEKTIEKDIHNKNAFKSDNKYIIDDKHINTKERQTETVTSDISKSYIPAIFIGKKNTYSNSNRVKRQAFNFANSIAEHYAAASTTEASYDIIRPNTSTTEKSAVTRPVPNQNFSVTRPTPKPNYAITRPTGPPRPEVTTLQEDSYPLYYRPGVSPEFIDPDVRPKPTKGPVILEPYAFISIFEFETDPEVIIGRDEDQMTEEEKKGYINLVEQKCSEFKATNIDIYPELRQRKNCKPNPLVVGGDAVTIEEFPHMALLGWSKVQGRGFKWLCGGSLISELYVLTAGHCTYQDKDKSIVKGGPQAVQLGSSYLGDLEAYLARIQSVIYHPKYVRAVSYYDIALVKMHKPVKFSRSIKPACLGVPPAVGQPIIATGWGKTSSSALPSQVLRSVSIFIQDLHSCDVLGMSRKITHGPSPDSQICAGDNRGGKDTCQGDSGGPAQIQDGCSWQVVAVTSIGRSCGAPNTPALYASLPRAFISAEVFGQSTPAPMT